MQYDRFLIGRQIQKARKAKRYTQDYVSDKANIGEKFLSQIECGKAGLSISTLLALCEILEVSPNYLLLVDSVGEEEDPIHSLVRQLSPRQLQDAEELLRIFVRNCTEQGTDGRPHTHAGR